MQGFILSLFPNEFNNLLPSADLFKKDYYDTTDIVIERNNFAKNTIFSRCHGLRIIYIFKGKAGHMVDNILQ